jgi:hypothetical protein
MTMPARLAVAATTAAVLLACGGIATTSVAGSSGSSGGGLEAGDDRDGGGGDGAITNGNRHIDPTPFPKTCSQGLAGLNPSAPFDAIQIRVTAEPVDDLPDAGGPAYTVQETRGTPCKTAKDHPTCLAAFDAALVKTSAWSTNANYRGGPAPPPDRWGFYVVTRADSVVVIATASDLAAFIAPIDSVTEAIHMRSGPLGGTTECPRVRTDADGYSFLDDGCGPYNGQTYTKTEVVTKVSRDGSIATTQTAGPFPDPTFSCAPVP